MPSKPRRATLMITCALVLSACANQPAPVVGCPTLPPWPKAPLVNWQPCPVGGAPDGVCVAPDEARLVGLWFRDLSRFREATDLCRGRAHQ
jgi:hypothetical protein